MTIQQRMNILKQFSLFTTLSDIELKMLAENATERTYPAGTIFLSPTKKIDGIYLIYKGVIKTYIVTSEGKYIPLRIRGPLYMAIERNIFGEDRKVTMEAFQEIHLLVLNRNDCKNMMMKNPDRMLSLYQLVIEKIQYSLEKFEEYYSLSLKTRTMNKLKELAPYFPQNSIPLSQEEIANLVGATRPKITEALLELRKEGKIIVNYRQIQIVPEGTE